MTEQQAIRDHGDRRRSRILADQSDPDKNQFVFAYTITITNTGNVAAQLVSRHWIITDAEHRVQEVKGLGVVGQQPRAEARARASSTRAARASRRRSARCAAPTRWSPRTGTRSTRRFRRSRCRCRARFTDGRSRLGTQRAPASIIVHHTMRRRCAAAPSSRRRSPPESPMPRPIRTAADPSMSTPRRCARRCRVRQVVRTTLVAAWRRSPAARSCRTAPPATAPPAPPRAVFTPTAHGPICPAGATIASTPRGPRFVVGCRALVARPRTQALWQAPCARRRRASTARDAAAVRAFFEANFTPYRVTAERRQRRAGSSPAITSRCSRARARDARVYACRCTRRPTTCSIVDLAELYPELKDKRVRGRLDGRRVVPYWSRADIERGDRDARGKALVYVERSGRGVLPRDPGLGPRRSSPTAASCASATPTRTATRIRSVGARADRSRRAARSSSASMQAIARGAGASRRRLPRAARRESELRVLSRGAAAAAGLARSARSTGRSARSACRCSRERTIAVDARYVPLGAPVFLATTRAVVERRRSQRLMLAQDTGGAIRGPVRADFFWGFGDAAGREAGRMRQEGRMWLLWPNGAPPPGRTERVSRLARNARTRDRPPARPRPAGRRDTTSAPARRPPRGGSPSRTPRARTSRTCPDARSAAPAGGAPTAAGTGRSSACRCRARACRASSRGSRRRSRPGPPSGRTWSARREARLEVLQQAQRMRVVGARPRLPVEARHRLEVVVHHVGRRRAQDVERAVEAAAEIRHQHFDLRAPANARAPRGCSRRNAARRRRAGRRDRRS